jgi:hypothetical protein
MNAIYSMADWIGWVFVKLSMWLDGLVYDADDSKPTGFAQRSVIGLAGASYRVGNWFYGVRP